MYINKTPLYYAVDKKLYDIVKVIVSSDKIDPNIVNISKK